MSLQHWLRPPTEDNLVSRAFNGSELKALQKRLITPLVAEFPTPEGEFVSSVGLHMASDTILFPKGFAMERQQPRECSG
jgi:hypothetical protein